MLHSCKTRKPMTVYRTFTTDCHNARIICYSMIFAYLNTVTRLCWIHRLAATDVAFNIKERSEHSLPPLLSELMMLTPYRTKALDRFVSFMVCAAYIR